MIKSILAESDLKEVLEEAGGDKLVVVLFLTNWCGSAVKVAKNVAEFSLKYQDNVIFAKVDCDEAERALTEGIEALPFFRLYRGGEIIESVQGAVPSALEQLILAHTLVVERL